MTEIESRRNMVGYGQSPPLVQWPNKAKIAVSFVLNYEEGGERCVLDGDIGSETFLSEMIMTPSYPERHMTMESIYEYGSRSGVWRILRIFKQRGIRLTIFAVSSALGKNPQVTEAFVESGHEIASHGFRWINYQQVSEDIERQHIKFAVEEITRLTGKAPLGWYTGRDSPNTRRLVVEHGGFIYDSDSYADDLPYWVQIGDKPHLVVPYSLDTNDMRFVTVQGFNSGEQFYHYLKDAFDVLYEEGSQFPKMLSIGLHCRIIGRPGRAKSLARFLDYILSHDYVWLPSRIEIARHWLESHPK